MSSKLFLSKQSKLWSNQEFRNRLVFLLGALVVFRIGSHIPVPGVDADALAQVYQQRGSGNILSMFNMFSGGALERFSIFAIGIMPYISSSIIMQLASEIIPALKSMKKEGNTGRKVITKYTRLGTVLLAAIQGVGVATFVLSQKIVVISSFEFYISTITCLVGGTMFLMWLGEQITERGIGNGISLIITAGIISGIPSAIALLNNLSQERPLFAVSLVVAVLLLILGIVFIESALRKIPVQYAKQQSSGNYFLARSAAHIPFKLNMAGVIPPIFASSIIMLPSMLLNWVGSENTKIISVLSILQHGQAAYMAIFAATIIFFCYFYTALAFSPREIAENLKKSGAFVPGVRPGEQTAKYLENVVLRLTLFGALYIAFVCLLPEVLTSFVGVPFYLGGTSLLILIVVVMDFNTQVTSYRVTQRYEGLVPNKSGLK